MIICTLWFIIFNHYYITTNGKETNKVGLGGSCHWCTEAIFQSLRGVIEVQQGWISSIEQPSLSEAVIVTFDEQIINLTTLIEIHIRSHSATSNHSMREKYRSAIYAFSEAQFHKSNLILQSLQNQFEEPFITQVLYFDTFKINTEKYLDYYHKNPDKPFCRNVIDPKLSELRKKYGNLMVY